MSKQQKLKFSSVISVSSVVNILFFLFKAFLCNGATLLKRKMFYHRDHRGHREKKEEMTFQRLKIPSVVIVFFFLCLPFLLFGVSDVEIDIKEPRHKDGKLFTNSGGIIKAKNLRIQAKTISLEEVNGEQILHAENDLFLVYGDKFFIGKALTYNLTTKTGRLENGIGNFDTFFIGGQDLLFHADNQIEIQKAYATTSDNKEPSWTIKANQVDVNDNFEEKAQNITVNLYEQPVFWIPRLSLSQNKEKKSDSKIRYKMFFEKHKQPLFVARYRVWDEEGLKVFLRGEYRINRGAGGGVEIDYQASEKAHLSSRNFYAYDTSSKTRSRYRFQGIFQNRSFEDKIESYASWDALSDKNFRSDFPTKAFELDTLERTEFSVKGNYDSLYASFYARPRINSFRGFKQELPSLKLAFKPYEIAKTGAIFENTLKFSYLNYVYAKELEPFVPGFQSGRFAAHQSLYRPFTLGFVGITPKIGLDSIFYTHSPSGGPALQTFAHYNLETAAPFEKRFSFGRHTIKPYATFQGLAPLAVKDHYIFSKEDGLHPLQQLDLGLQNTLLFKNNEYTMNMGCMHFFDAKFFERPFPKAFFDLSCHFPYFTLSTLCLMNLEKTTLDSAHLELGWTLSEGVALSLEFRHRSPYAFRKNDRTSYLLDLAHSPIDLLASPLSDERNTLIARCHLELSPLWTLKIYNHTGLRPNAPLYHESIFELSTIVSNVLKLKCAYTRTTTSNQFTFSLATLTK